MAKRIPKFKFQIVSLGKIPRRDPTVFPPDNKRGSQYDEVLQALNENPGRAVKITEKDSVPLVNLSADDRRDISSALLTISKNYLRHSKRTGRLQRIRTQVEVDAVYAAIEEEYELMPFWALSVARPQRMPSNTKRPATGGG